MRPFDWLVIVLYMIAMLAIGFYTGRKTKTATEYFVGTRRVNPIWAGLSLLATLLSTISYLAYPGEVIANGTGFLWQAIAWPIAFIIVGYFLIPHIMAIPVSSGYELLESRLGASTRLLAASFFLLLRLCWMALILHTACTAMAEITGLRREWLILIMGIVTTIYTTEGGMMAVIWTDVVQFFIFVAGAIFTVIFLQSRADFGMLDTIRQLGEQAKDTPFFSTDLSQRMSGLGIAFSIGLWWIAACGSDQLAMQKFFTTRDARAARRTFLVNLIGSAVTLIALAAVGIGLGNYFRLHPELLPARLQNVSDPTVADKIFPYFISTGLPVGLCGLVIAALFSAAMSSLSSGVNSVTTVLTVDFFARVKPRRGFPLDDPLGAAPTPAATEDDLPNRAFVRIVAAVVGTLAMAGALPIAWMRFNFFEVANRILDPFAGPLFGLFLLAFYDRRSSARAAWIGVIAGFLAAQLLTYAHNLFALPRPLSFVWIMPVGIGATVSVGALAARLLPRPSDEPIYSRST